MLLSVGSSGKLIVGLGIANSRASGSCYLSGARCSGSSSATNEHGDEALVRQATPRVGQRAWPKVRFSTIADIADDLHCCSVAPKLSFAERVGRSYRRDHVFSMWGGGALLVFMGLLFLLAQFGS